MVDTYDAWAITGIKTWFDKAWAKVKGLFS